MGDQQDRATELAVEAAEQLEDFGGGRAVEVAGGFVGQQQGRSRHQRARHRHPLLLPARELVGLALLQPGQSHLRQQAARALDLLPRGLATGHHQRHQHVFQRGEGLDEVVCRELGLDTAPPDLREWSELVQRIHARSGQVVIAMVGKYTKLHDAYLSIIESLNHAGYAAGVHVEIKWVNSEGVTPQNAPELLKGIDGMIIPGGFGERGIEGKIAACRYARENGIPFLGICLGMQVAVIEFARHVCGLQEANSAEFDEGSPHRVIDLMEEQKGITDKGGTMRLGAYPCELAPGSLLHRLYGRDQISERHRHRFEVNNAYRGILAQHGLSLSGTSPDGRLVEAVELKNHPFYVGVQYHPEFKSRPNRPHPLFLGLVNAAVEGRV
mgnify:CR=1 FL=1